MTGLMIAGTSSDAGKSLVVTGLCRAYARRGLRVAPYKAQNMSNNSAVCADGAEIGRAQHLQAQAAGVEPSSLHNPVLLKPGTDRRAFVVVRGRPHGVLGAGEYATGRAHLAKAAFAAYAELAASSDLVLVEGAGSPAEINLRSRDYVNMGLARRFGLPVVVVGDIDRGGVLASLYGTWALLDDADRALLAGYLINKFRGDRGVLEPGLAEISRRTGLPCLGVLPWLEGVWLDGEDALEIARWSRRPEPVEDGADRLTVAVVSFPRISNATDVDALAHTPGVEVVVTADADAAASADLLVLPGTRATVADLAWLRSRGLDAVVAARHAAGRPTLGICGGYEMLADTIVDAVESGAGRVPGLGVLPIEVTFSADKVTARPTHHWRGREVTGYEIHHGVCTPTGPAEPFLDGCRVAATSGTMLHGALEDDAFRNAYLTDVARTVTSGWRPDPGATPYAAARERMIDTLADAMEEHLDLDALLRLAHAPMHHGRPFETVASRPPQGPPSASRRAARGAPQPASPSPQPDLRHHGDADLAPGLRDLAVNVRQAAPPAWLLDVIEAGSARWAAYPDPRPARAAVAQRHRVGVEQVLSTAGGTEAFTLVATALGVRRPVVVHPQFTEPEAALRAAGLDVRRVLLRDDDGFTLDPDRVPEDADLVAVGNPTNPTGVLHPADTLRRLARPGRVLLVDEAFMDFVPGEPGTLIGNGMAGIVVVRSLTKMWGIAGLRAGYVVGDPALVARLAAAQQPWAVPTPALDAMVACSSPDALDEADAAARRTERDRAALVDALAASGYRVAARSQAPFVLVDTSPAGAGSVRGRLADAGLAVRRGETFPGLGPGWIRVAVRDTATSQRLADALAALRTDGVRHHGIRHDGARADRAEAPR